MDRRRFLTGTGGLALVTTSSGSGLIPLSRDHRDIMGRGFHETDGKSTTVAQQLQDLSVDAFIVLHRGKILCEQYFHGMRPETPHILFSMNKSIVSSVIATLLADKLLDETTTIETYIPALKNTAYAGATILQILDMESGILYRYAGDNPESAQHERAIGPAVATSQGPVGDLDSIATELTPELG